MKTIGLIGGMSWESTAEYYRLLNEFTRRRLGGLHSARCVLYSVDFAEIEQLQVQGRWAEAGEILVSAAQSLEEAGVDMVLICTNTMHKVADQVEAALSVPTAPGRRHGGCCAGRGRAPGRLARHRVHHGAGFLPRSPGGERPTSASPGLRGARARTPGDL